MLIKHKAIVVLPLTND